MSLPVGGVVATEYQFEIVERIGSVQRFTVHDGLGMPGDYSLIDVPHFVDLDLLSNSRSFHFQADFHGFSRMA